jgi:hypothetical protein
MPIMKRFALAAMALAAMSSVHAAQGQEQHSRANTGSSARASAPPRQPVVINISRSASGGRSRNFPAQRAAQFKPPARPLSGQAARPGTGKAQRPAGPASQSAAAPTLAAHGSGAAAMGMRATAVAHHHAFTPGYIRQKLKKLGVASEPAFITDRAEMIHTDQKHSSIPLPSMGADRAALRSTLIGPRGTGASQVRAQMARVSGSGWRAQVEADRRSESRPGHYYWHKDSGFNYCHYLDGSGYHWYGWYLGEQFFWTRNFSGRWWWYDADFDRWDFYNDNFWWWQDPYHVGDLYCYNEGDYTPVNSRDDQVAVTQPEAVSLQTFDSPDGTRKIKLVADTEDAFLYDAADPPSFSPLYLASGVQSVEFSQAGNGRPLEIFLKLNDGSFDLFDGQGHPYNP